MQYASVEYQTEPESDPLKICWKQYIHMINTYNIYSIEI